jgi:hypothetical protein
LLQAFLQVALAVFVQSLALLVAVQVQSLAGVMLVQRMGG